MNTNLKFAVLGVLATYSLSAFATVTGTKHDLSTADTDRVCEFCHTPHFSNTAVEVPLWNRVLAAKTYTMYSSSTLDSTQASQPGDYSLVCLGCHDGVLAYGTDPRGNTLSDKHDLVNAPGSGGVPDDSSYPNCQACHPSFYGLADNPSMRIGTDLGDDHPVGITYPTTAQDPAFNAPPDTSVGWWTATTDNLKLFNGSIECATCHNPHGTSYAPFLRITNAGSNMCLACHIK